MKEQIQKIREITGAGVMECKKALEDAGGDFDKAISLIQERGLIRAEKKGERATGAGVLHAYTHNGRVGVMLDLRCETDFVARTEIFKELAHDLVMHIAAMDPKDINEFMLQNYVKDESITIEALIKQVIAKSGENVRIERFCRYEI